MSIRIVLADDHAAFRHCLKALLEQQPGLAVVHDAGGGLAALAAIQDATHVLPDVMVLDVGMHDLGGLHVAKQLIDRHPGLRILMLSWFDDLPFVKAAGAAGCRGYMLKDDPLPELVHAIREIAAGSSYLSATVRNAQLCGDSISAFC